MSSQEHLKRIFISENTSYSYWQKQPSGPDGLKRVFVGWEVEPPPVDSGVPIRVAELISSALCRCFTVNYLNSGKSPCPENINGCEHEVFYPGFWQRLLRRPVFQMTATNNPEIAQAMFYENKYSWELGFQRAILSDSEVMRALDYQLIHKFFYDPLGVDLSQHINCSGLLLPGVDGDFVELIFYREDALADFMNAISSVCSDRGLSFGKL